MSETGGMIMRQDLRNQQQAEERTKKTKKQPKSIHFEKCILMSTSFLRWRSSGSQHASLGSTEGTTDVFVAGMIFFFNPVHKEKLLPLLAVVESRPSSRRFLRGPLTLFRF